jgi:hypothetical protein
VSQGPSGHRLRRVVCHCCGCTGCAYWTDVITGLHSLHALLLAAWGWHSGHAGDNVILWLCGLCAVPLAAQAVYGSVIALALIVVVAFLFLVFVAVAVAAAVAVSLCVRMVQQKRRPCATDVKPSASPWPQAPSPLQAPRTTYLLASKWRRCFRGRMSSNP